MPPDSEKYSLNEMCPGQTLAAGCETAATSLYAIAPSVPV